MRRKGIKKHHRRKSYIFHTNDGGTLSSVVEIINLV